MRMFDALKADAEKLRALTGETQSFMISCDDCGGEGGYEVAYAATSKWGDPTPGGEWIECPTCHGSGWLDNHEPEPPLDPDEIFPPFSD
jgi:DnaJ-class molecular chaperone